MISAGEGLDPNEPESPETDAGLQSGDEPPETTDGVQSESPTGTVQDTVTEPEGTPAREASDSEAGIFTAFDKGVPEELRPQAMELKKRAQAYLTKKTQAHAEEVRQLKAQQLAPEAHQALNEYARLDTLIATNPVEGFRTIARRLQQNGIIASADQFLADFGKAATPPTEEEIDPESIQDWQTARKFMDRREARREEKFLTELKARDEKIAKLEGNFQGTEQERQRVEYRDHGQKALMTAARQYPDFAMRNKDGKILIDESGAPKLSEQGKKAVDLVLSKRVTGPTALQDAWDLVTVPALREQLKQVEGKNKTITQGIRGSQPAPGSKLIKTSPTAEAGKNVFDRAKASVLRGGLGV